MSAPGEPLFPGAVRTTELGAIIALGRREGPPELVLGPEEKALRDEYLAWPLREAEWCWGRLAGKTLLQRMFGLDPARVQLLRRESGAPKVVVDGVDHPSLFVSLSHTGRWAVAAVSRKPVGVDVADDEDGARLHRITRRALNDGEAEAIGAFDSHAHSAAVWALKEAGLKLREGGVFQPGARSVRVTSLAPASVADGTMAVRLFRVDEGAIALAANV